MSPIVPAATKKAVPIEGLPLAINEPKAINPPHKILRPTGRASREQ